MKKRLIFMVFMFLFLNLFGCSHENKQINTKKDTQEQTIENQSLKYNQYRIDFQNILQKPELPTGCEVTSLTMVLNHFGYQIDKCTLADDYLKKGNINHTDFSKAFVGNPRSEESYGCYVDVIEDCALAYFKAVQSNDCIHNLTGKDFTTLLRYVQNGIPVITWTTINLLEPYGTTEWTINGKNIEWLANEHCVVLTGFDMAKNIVYVSDPLKGNVTYNLDLFEKRYKQMSSQALVIMESQKETK